MVQDFFQLHVQNQNAGYSWLCRVYFCATLESNSMRCKTHAETKKMTSSPDKTFVLDANERWTKFGFKGQHFNTPKTHMVFVLHRLMWKATWHACLNWYPFLIHFNFVAEFAGVDFSPSVYNNVFLPILSYEERSPTMGWLQSLNLHHPTAKAEKET